MSYTLQASDAELQSPKSLELIGAAGVGRSNNDIDEMKSSKMLEQVSSGGKRRVILLHVPPQSGYGDESSFTPACGLRAQSRRFRQ